MSSLESAFMNAFVDAMKEATADGFDEAILFSSGGTSLAQLAKEDHPYARRHGFPLRDPEIINAQTGAFRAAWQNPEPVVMGDMVEGFIENHDPVADYLTQPLGSPKSTMFQRPIDEEVEAATATALEKRINENLDKFSKLTINL